MELAPRRTFPEPLEVDAKNPALPPGCDLETYYRAESRPLHALKTLWREHGMEVGFEMWLKLRDRGRKDLWWLGKEVLHKDLTRWHEEPCARLFVQKNFDGAYRLGYSIGEVHEAIGLQDRKKEMLFLASRGGFKSTLDGIDCVQWMLNCPDIRILILTGEYKLALAFMSEIKGYFYLAEKAPQRMIHKLFPEYTLRGKDGTSESPLECPARVHNQKEPSLWVNAIVANLSGWHCDLRKMDDVVTDENSNNPDSRGQDGKLKLKIDGTDNLVDEWGFTDIIGTPYYIDDYYALRIAAAEAGEAPLEFGKFPCWQVKQRFIGTPLKELTENMVTLLFPEKLTFKSLRQKLVKNERLFRGQQLCEPSADASAPITFTEAVLQKHLVSTAPSGGDMFITWDTSFARTSYADYSAGVCGRIIPGDERFDLYIMEVIFGRWRPSELSFQIVQFEKKWNPKATLIERPAGDELLRIDMQRQAQRFQVPLNIIWKTVSNAPDAKRNEIKSVETMLANDQIWFVGGQWIDETFSQFMRYTGERKNKGRKDDIPDAIAKMQYFCPFMDSNKELEAAKEAQRLREEQRVVYARIFEPAAQAFTPPPSQTSMRQRLFGSLAR